jgi:hypothetical protein
VLSLVIERETAGSGIETNSFSTRTSSICGQLKDLPKRMLKVLVSLSLYVLTHKGAAAAKHERV